MKYFKSNIGFIISMILLAIVAFNPDAKSFILKGLIKTGLYQPDFKRANTESKLIAPSTIFRSASGAQIDIADSKGKVIFLNFWAAWCPPCLAEMPSINNLAEHFKNEEGIIFLMANVDGELKSSEAFFKKNSLHLPAFIPAGIIPKEIFQGSLPTTIIINKDGEIVYQHEGIADYSSTETKDLIKRLLSE